MNDFDGDSLWSNLKRWVVVPVLGGLVGWATLLVYPNASPLLTGIIGAWLTELVVWVGFVLLPGVLVVLLLIVLALLGGLSRVLPGGRKRAEELEKELQDFQDRISEPYPPTGGGFE